MTRNSRFKILFFAAALAAAPLAGAAFAHGSMKPVHGGQVALAGETVVELVRGAKGVTVYLSDEDQPVASAGMTGKLIVTEGANKRTIELKGGAGNRFEAPGLKIANGAKVTVVLVDWKTEAKGMATILVK